MTILRPVLAAALAAVPACTGGMTPPPQVRSDLARDTSPQVSDAAYAELVAGNTAFAIDLYGQVANQSGNLFFSPHSISEALAMTYAGAAGDTATQMAAALHFTLPPDQLHAAMNRLDLDLASRAQAADSDTRPFVLHDVDGLWGQQGATFQQPFLDTLALDYGAGMYVLDFAGDPDGARGTINDWVADQTEQRITDLLPPGSIDTLTRLVLTNAIYFSAAWDNPFDPADTADAPFTTGAGETVSVASLHQVAEVGYGAGDGFQVAELPYDGDQLAMDIVVPDGPLAELEAGLTPDSLAAMLATVEPTELTLTLPKFDFTQPLDLVPVLEALGMVDAFTQSADFSGIDGARDLQITGVLHKGYVGIDEAGTEAAAATAVVVGTTSVPPRATLAVDRPFLFLIRDRPTGAILFLGRVVDPR